MRNRVGTGVCQLGSEVPVSLCKAIEQALPALQARTTQSVPSIAQR